jgi:hypothetical protein
MEEQPKRTWPVAAKRAWSTPKMREIPLTDDILAHFKQAESASPAEAPAKKAAARR